MGNHLVCLPVAAAAVVVVVVVVVAVHSLQAAFPNIVILVTVA